MANELKPCPFCGSKARMWPSQTKSDSEGSYEIIGCSNIDCLIEPTTEEYLPYAEAIAAWNTRPAPAATDTGLVTVGVQYAHEHSITGRAMWGWQKEWKGCSAIGTRELVTRSQAEAIIAAKDATLQDAIDCVKVLTDEKNKFEADNAALTARVKELEKHVEELQGKNNAETCACSYDAAGDVCKGHSPAVKALETQLAAARKALEPFSKFAGALFERNFNDPDVVDRISAADGGVLQLTAKDFFEARAALEAKP